MNILSVKQNVILDKVDAIDRSKSSTGKCNVKSFSEYSTYTVHVTAIGPPLNQTKDGTCERGSSKSKFDRPCEFMVSIMFSSMLVTTHTSARGTTWQKILSDEGSIFRGIMALTWFLDIFII
jgi:hypothetical protein